MNRDEAVKIGREAAAAHEWEHNYINASDPKWEPHAWVIEAILKAAAPPASEPRALPNEREAFERYRAALKKIASWGVVYPEHNEDYGSIAVVTAREAFTEADYEADFFASPPEEPAQAVFRKALEKIVKWELPPTGKFWDKERLQPTSYETEYGSLGAKEYIRGIAREALFTPPAPANPPAPRAESEAGEVRDFHRVNPPTVPALVKRIGEVAAFWAYMMEIDNTDSADEYSKVHAQLVRDLAALAHPTPPNPADAVSGETQALADECYRRAANLRNAGKDGPAFLATADLLTRCARALSQPAIVPSP